MNGRLSDRQNRGKSAAGGSRDGFSLHISEERLTAPAIHVVGVRRRVNCDSFVGRTAMKFNFFPPTKPLGQLLCCSKVMFPLWWAEGQAHFRKKKFIIFNICRAAIAGGVTVELTGNEIKSTEGTKSTEGAPCLAGLGWSLRLCHCNLLQRRGGNLVTIMQTRLMYLRQWLSPTTRRLILVTLLPQNWSCPAERYPDQSARLFSFYSYL